MYLRTNKGSVLAANDFLGVGDFLFSVSTTQPYGFCLILTEEGDLQFYYGTTQNPQLGTGPSLRYSSMLADWTHSLYKDPSFKTGVSGDYFAIMQGDGNFCVYRGTGPTANRGFCWSTNTYSKGTAPYAAVLGTDGNFQLGGSFRNGQVTATWKTNMTYPSQRVVTGDCLVATPSGGQWLAFNDTLVSGQPSAGHPYMAWMQHDDLVLACNTPPGRPLVLPPGSPGGSGTQVYWSAVNNRPGNVYGRNLGGGLHAVMQSDGNLVVYNGTDPGHQGSAYWAITNQGRPAGNYKAQIQADGTLTVGPSAAGSQPFFTSAQGTTLVLTFLSGNNQTVHVNGGYDVVAYANPLVIGVRYPSLIPVGAGVQVTFGQWVSTEGEVWVYYAPENSLNNCSITVATEQDGTAFVHMWGQSVLGGPDQPGEVGLTVTVAGTGGYQGTSDNSTGHQYVWMDGQ